jgi:methyl-accepting chemotaxis protein
MKIANRSLKFKLIAITSGILVTIGAAFYGILHTVVEDERQVVLKTLGSTANMLNDAVMAQFFERYGDVQAFALNPDVQSGNRTQIAEALNAYVALYGIYDLVLVTDTQGNIVASNTKDPTGKPIKYEAILGKNVSDQEWFHNTLAGKTHDEKENNFAGTFADEIKEDAVVTEAYGEKRYAGGFSAQLKDKSGKLLGVISNRAGSRWLQAPIEEAAHSLKQSGFKNFEVVLMGKEDTIQAYMSPLRLKGKMDFNSDLSLIGSKILLEEKNPALELAKAESESGYLDFHHEQFGQLMAAGHSPVAGAKMVDSLGWKVVAYGVEEEVVASVMALKKAAIAILILTILGAIAIMTWYSNGLSKTLRNIAVEVNSSSGEVGSLSERMASASSELSSSTTEQAAALQETVSSIDEVSAMIAKNAENAKRSKESSNLSSDAAQKGKDAVDQMIHSIEEINQANGNIMNQIEEGNQQLAEIVKLISEIGNKTKVINDIVFQTKLLSFNASVEAARAGEHGKGFAVVAEEVGNLAQMSGNAAKEISQMLDGSVQKVDSIVNASRTRVEKLMSESKSKVEAGTITAKKCGEVLDEIVKNVSEVNMMVSEITTASQEQSQGVSEINKAMNQLDQVTQSNAASSQDASNVAALLRNQSEGLRKVIESLIQTVEGSGNDTKSLSKPSDPPTGKVIPFAKAEKPEFKKAAGAEPIPSREDKRFEEV